MVVHCDRIRKYHAREEIDLDVEVSAVSGSCGDRRRAEPSVGCGTSASNEETEFSDSVGLESIATKSGSSNSVDPRVQVDSRKTGHLPCDDREDCDEIGPQDANGTSRENNDLEDHEHVNLEQFTVGKFRLPGGSKNVSSDLKTGTRQSKRNIRPPQRYTPS